MHPDLQDAITFHEAILAEGGKALVGYTQPKILANIVLLSEIPTTYDKKEQRQVNSGNLLLRGVPGVGKTTLAHVIANELGVGFKQTSGPVLERGWAAKAGLGFIGKNAMLISRRHGNWLFLATILTRQEFLPDATLPASSPALMKNKPQGSGGLVWN